MFSKSITHCMLLIVEPSFNAMNWLFLNVRTQPFAFTFCNILGLSRSVFILVCFIFLRYSDYIILRHKFHEFSQIISNFFSTRIKKICADLYCFYFELKFHELLLICVSDFTILNFGLSQFTNCKYNFFC